MQSSNYKQMIVAAVAAMTLAGTAHAQQAREVPFGLPSKSLVAAPPRIAEEMGLFAKYQLTPKFTYIESTSATATALIAKSVEFATTGSTEVIAANARNQALVIVANHYNGLAGSLVLSKAVVDKLGVSPDAPIADRLKALNDLSIASVSAVSSFTISYKGAAASVGATPRFAYMGVAAMGAALETGAVQGIIATAPFWALPVIKGTGVLWLSPPKGDLPAQFMPSTASLVATTKEFAQANPELVKKVGAVFDDLSEAVEKRPADVKAAIAKLYPELDAKTLDLVFSMEAKAFNGKRLTPDDIKHDIAYIKLSGSDFGPIDKVDPASTLAR